ncbi:DUF5916 domain-containing protein [uncultured Tenacibaculum sp.]|uniref:DUF5916 domain-containing protein n=1 Tax=uncultured Tenacibaculum sp. TaxID=174713 RepID=UPI0026336894|nr:DUF5916 domain-containing protein [uncultured Tenacibaculum sp.]
MNFKMLTFVFLLYSLGIYAQKSITTNTISQHIKIDGLLNEDTWKTHLKKVQLKQLSPNNGNLHSNASKIAITNDDSFFYIAAELSSPSITNILTSRDDVGTSDYFGFMIDLFGANREAWAFLVTPANVQTDIKLTPNGNYGEWNAVWESAVKIYDDKWTIELKIPFNSLRFPKKDFSNITINFERFDAVNNENSFWNYINPNINGLLNQFGDLKGLKNVSPPINLSFNPFVSMINEKTPNKLNTYTFTGGLDLKYVHNNAYTIDVSLIPDFSQALSDNQVFNLSPFEIRFNENRQFFVEGAEIFDKGGYLYTRRIGGTPVNKNNFNIEKNEEIINNPISSNIINLLKFTGKTEKGLSIGILNGITSKSEATVKNTVTNETMNIETNPLTNYNSIVIDKTLKNNSFLTFINNSVIRSGNTYDSNLSALLYRWYNKKRTYSMYFKKALSQKYYANLDNQFGHEYYASLSKISGKWTGNVSFYLLDDTFDNNDFGYLPRNNQLTLKSNITYTNNNPKKTFSQYRINLQHSRKYYYTLLENEQTYYKLNTSATFKKNNHKAYAVFTYVEKGKNFYEPRVKDRYFNKPAFTETVLEYQTNRNKNLYFAAYFVAVNYLNSDIYTNEIVTGYGVRCRLGQHLFFKLEQDLTKNPSSAGYITQQGSDIIFGKRSIKELTNSLHVNYAINAKLNISTRLRHYWIQVDYDKQFTLLNDGNLTTNNYTINPNNYDENYNNFTIDFIAKWQFAPASEISLGYKLGSNFYNNDVKSSYFSNLKSTLKENSSNTMSLKMTYFLDFNKIKEKLF